MNTEFKSISLSDSNSLGAATGKKRSYETLGMFSSERNLLFFIVNCPAASVECEYGVLGHLVRCLKLPRGRDWP